MIPIIKGKEPKELTEHRATPNADFNGLDKDILRLALIKEQSHLCAYCMQRISFELGKTHDTKLEHILPQSDPAASITTDLDYKNLVLCCSGEYTYHGKPYRYCDTAKGDYTSKYYATQPPGTSFTQMLDPVKRHGIVNLIQYKSDGSIVWPTQSGNEGDKVLNLNCDFL